MSQQIVNINDSIKTFQEKFNVLSGNLGDIDLTGLTATDVSAAIRELAVNQGNLSSLTTDANGIIGALNEHDSELGTITSAAMGTSAHTVSGAIAELDSDRDRLVALIEPTRALDTASTTITAAINELQGQIDLLDSGASAQTALIGDLSSLVTTEKSTVVGAINELASPTVTAGTYGTASAIPTLTVNSRGQITSIGTAAVAGVTSFGYNTSTGVITIGTADGGSHPATITLAPFSTSNLAEGTNQYFTTARARSSVSAGAGIAYNSSTGSISTTLRIYDVNGSQIWP